MVYILKKYIFLKCSIIYIKSKFDINVNAICPGATNTAMIEGFTGEKRENFLNTIPLRRFGEPEDVANMALFLASDMARQVTGEISDVDGGVMLD